MKTKIFIIVLTFGIFLRAYSQRPALELTFTAIDSASYVQLDSIKIMNRTRNIDTTLYWPDTVLLLNYLVGIDEINNKTELHLFQNYPNPAKEQTTITFYIPKKEMVNILITDILGRKIISTKKLLEKGSHDFNFKMGQSELYIFTATWKETSHSIKIINAKQGINTDCSLTYLGHSKTQPQFKKTVQDFIYLEGDELLNIGYQGTLQSGLLDSPEENKTYTFQFATNIPCPGTPTVEYEGQVYNTIQIFSQCWIKENLNVGIMALGIFEMSDDGIIEKYCYNDKLDSCSKYGGLYQWDEMMQYTTQQGTQGICPPGWHIPSDEEWKVLEGAVDSQYGIGDIEWDLGMRTRGFDAALNLKTTGGWKYEGNGTDEVDFSALPGGYRTYYGSFDAGFGSGLWWSTTVYDSYYEWSRYLFYGGDGVNRSHYPKTEGYSVRCIKN